MPGLPSSRRTLLPLAGVLAGVLAFNCATGTPVIASDDTHDPLEPVNRLIFHANDAIDQYMFRPVALAYRTVVPMPARNAVSNLLYWLKSPVSIASNFLQGNIGDGLSTTAWYVVNVVTLGTYDVASEIGLRHYPQDIGLTLREYGVGGGPYLVLPFLGPSNLRDSIGNVADRAIDPIGYLGYSNFREPYSIGRSVLQGIESRVENFDQIDSLRADSVDYYAAVRAIYQQYRDPAGEDEDDPFHDPEFNIMEDPDGVIPGPETKDISSGQQRQ